MHIHRVRQLFGRGHNPTL
uniref:Uncharacterized protein n=1 Tax=Arundo donax TaxID=35708 RepID=A0A0A8YD44_ARUDO